MGFKPFDWLKRTYNRNVHGSRHGELHGFANENNVGDMFTAPGLQEGTVGWQSSYATMPGMTFGGYSPLGYGGFQPGMGLNLALGAPTPPNQTTSAFDPIGAVKGLAGDAAGSVKDMWGGLEPMEKAQIMAAILQGGFNAYAGYKQGQREDKERKRYYKERDQSAAAMAPYIRELLQGA